MMDMDTVSVLTPLDLSAVFDTVDHDILLHRLEHTFGFQGTALAWLRSYLSGRTQIVSIDERLSSSATIHCGFPQGSVLGSILFILYTQPISCAIGSHPVSHQLYADDTQIYSSSCPIKNHCYNPQHGEMHM